jgi:hypothetical protein
MAKAPPGDRQRPWRPVSNGFEDMIAVSRAWTARSLWQFSG